jgi:hypothetical protein
MVSERRRRHTERAVEGEIRRCPQPAKQRRGASGMTQGRRMFALTELHARRGQQYQSLEQRTGWAASIRNLPKPLPSLMSLPVKTVIKEIKTPEECV